MKDRASAWFASLQDSICTALEQADGLGRFREDHWERPGGGGGRSRVIENGRIIEKGGVNFSAVHGQLSEKAQKGLGLPSADFFATGISIVLHPKSPMVPIIHMNTRYFEMEGGHSWFGGGIDLTPHYIDRRDAQHFHQTLKAVCDKHHPNYYTDFKAWADRYFFLKHRNETRGVGGIFYDRLAATPEISLEARFAFTQDVGSAFAPIYTGFMAKHANDAYGEAEKEWQLLRRSRYVEFNLVWDQGTKFGLETDGRTESILMSLPPLAAWKYDYSPAAGSKEAETLNLLKQDIDWLDTSKLL